MIESIHTLKQLVDAGKKVAYQNDSYLVIKGQDGEYYIKSVATGHAIKLIQPQTGRPNGDIKDFYLMPDMTLEEFTSKKTDPPMGPGPIYYPDNYQIIVTEENQYLVECSNWNKTFNNLQDAEQCLWEEWKDS